MSLTSLFWKNYNDVEIEVLEAELIDVFGSSTIKQVQASPREKPNEEGAKT
jgi:hypothetical protein